jgi:hypothetical protein
MDEATPNPRDPQPTPDSENTVTQPPESEISPPPAGKIVNEAQWTEREAALQRQIEAERDARRQAEVKASYAEDEARRLKELQSQPPEPTKPKARRKVQTVGFWEVEEED